MPRLCATTQRFSTKSYRKWSPVRSVRQGETTQIAPLPIRRNHVENVLQAGARFSHGRRGHMMAGVGPDVPFHIFIHLAEGEGGQVGGGGGGVEHEGEKRAGVGATGQRGVGQGG